ncbi:MAG: hypothetical protein V4473_02875 [Patescibacteria group bacterium]
MHRTALGTLRLISVSIVIIVIAGYSLFQAQKLIRGPIIDIYTPENGVTFTSPLIEISGRARNISYINLDDRKIFTDKDGYFKEKFVLSPGRNVIKLDAEDKFKTSRQKLIQVVLKEY